MVERLDDYEANRQADNPESLTSSLLAIIGDEVLFEVDLESMELAPYSSYEVGDMRRLMRRLTERCLASNKAAVTGMLASSYPKLCRNASALQTAANRYNAHLREADGNGIDKQGEVMRADLEKRGSAVSHHYFLELEVFPKVKDILERVYENDDT